MHSAPDERDVTRYYEAALVGLRHLEALKPTGRRFGPDADSRWRHFAGDLTATDRMDILIRDADAQWPAAFGARTAFDREGVPEDESFGVGFPRLDPVDAEPLWRRIATTTAPPTLAATLDAIATAWGLKLAPFSPPAISSNDRLVVAGPAAITAVLAAFERGGRDLDWHDQVVVLATPPAHRQLAAIGGALLGSLKATRFALPTTGFLRTQTIVSPDADEADRARL